MTLRTYNFVNGPETDTLPNTTDIVSYALSTKSDSYTITDTDGIGTFIQTGADKTFTLPTAADNTDRKLSFVNAGSGYLDIAAEGSEKINGSLSSVRLGGSYDCLTMQCNGTGWLIISKNESIYTVIDKTANYTLTAFEASNKYIFTNTGASGTIDLELPSAQAGYEVTVIRAAAQTLQVSAASGDDLNNADLSAVQEAETDTTNAVAIFRCVDSGSWYIESSATWSEVV